MFVVSLIAVVVLSLMTLYLYLIWNFNYWKNRGVSGPNPKPLFGTIPNLILQKRNLYYDIHDSYTKYKEKPFAGIFFMRTPQILAIDPKFVKEIMIKNFKNFQDNDFVGFFEKESDPIFGRNQFFLGGYEWREKRAEITQAFTPARIKALYPLLEDICKKMTKYVKKESDKNSIDGFDCKELAGKFTTDVVSSCIFAADANSFTEDEDIIRKMGKEMISWNWKNLLYFGLIFLCPYIKKIWKMSFVDKKIEHFFVKLMEDAIISRENTNIDRNDYLQFLVQLKSKKKLSSIDLTAHGVTFFIDGFETSSLVMSYAFYELGRNKYVQDKLRKEITKHDHLDHDLINEMTYLDQVFYEVLRLHPPLFNLTRRCTESIELTVSEDKKIFIEKGMAINIPIYSIHTDVKYYDRPLEFYPERFNQENGGVKAFRDKGVLMPFGDGPRICLGLRFALAQAKAGLVEIVRNFELSVNRKTQEPIQLDPKEYFSLPLGGIWVDFKTI